MPWIISSYSLHGSKVSIDEWRGNGELMVDLTKALCHLTSRRFDEIPRLGSFSQIETNVWHDWGFFEFKAFKKGTGHFKFKDDNVWALFNQNIARIKGFPLPESFK